MCRRGHTIYGHIQLFPVKTCAELWITQNFFKNIRKNAKIYCLSTGFLVLFNMRPAIKKDCRAFNTAWLQSFKIIENRLNKGGFNDLRQKENLGIVRHKAP